MKVLISLAICLAFASGLANSTVCRSRRAVPVMDFDESPEQEEPEPIEESEEFAPYVPTHGSQSTEVLDNFDERPDCEPDSDEEPFELCDEPEIAPPNPDVFTGNECKDAALNGVHMPYPGDPTHFIQCDNGKVVVKTCGEYLHFNKVTKTCDWPENGGYLFSKKP